MTLQRTFQLEEAEVSLPVWLDRGILVASLLACAVALSMNVADPDLWGHVQYGRDALAQGLPATTTYSYIAEGYPWINHEIIAEYALALGADWLGGAGMLIAKTLLGMAIVGLIVRRAFQQGVGLVPVCGTALLVAICLASHWTLRPQLFSYACFTALLALLSYAFDGWEGNWQLPLGWLRRVKAVLPDREPQSGLTTALAAAQEPLPPLPYSVERLKLLWLVPVLIAFWTNAHGGFLAGLCIYVAYLGLRGLEAVARKGREAEGLLRRFGLMVAAAVVATLLNPYSFRFHTWLWHDLSVPRPEITEWRAPDFLDPQSLPLIALLVAWIACLALSRKRHDFTLQVIMALVAWQTVSHLRHGAFLAIAFGWWMPVHVESVLQRLGIGKRLKSDEEVRFGWAAPEDPSFTAGLSPVMQRGFAVLLVVMIALCGGQLVWKVSQLRVERHKFPVSAVSYVADRGLTGKMVCTFNWAQYVLAALGPKAPGEPGILVQVDGRCRTSYSQEMLDTHFDFILGEVGPDLRYRDPASGPFDPVRVLDEGRPDLVLIDRGQEPSVAAMQTQLDRWTLLYQDELAQLWGRTTKYGDPKSAYFIPKNERRVGQVLQRGTTPWPAIPDRQSPSALASLQ